MRSLSVIFILAAAIAFAALAAGCSAGSRQEITSGHGQIPSAEPESAAAYDGYDMAAYFALGKAVRGTPQLSLLWNGATYLFSSEEHRASFAANPEKYLPGLEAHCPVSLSEGKEVDGDPGAWRIFRDRLYFFINEDAARRFDGAPEKILKNAEKEKK